MRVGASVTPSIGSTMQGDDRVALAQRVERRPGVAVEREAELGQQRARRLGDVVGRLAVAHRLQEGGHLQQRVLAHLRRRRVAGDAVGRDLEAEDALLGHADAVEPLLAEREDGAGALVQQQVAAHGVGVVLGQPDGALAAAGLLVDHADDEQVAVRRAPARAGERRSRPPPRPRSGTSCRARRGPTARRRRRRPTTGRAATRRRRRARCRRARAGTASGRRRLRAGARRGSGRSSVRPSSSTSKPASRSRPASSSWAGRSLPGGLTVLRRTRRCSSSVVSRSRSSSAIGSPGYATAPGRWSTGARERIWA